MAVIRNDQVESTRGTAGDDHLIHHRDLSITNNHSSIGLSAGPGNDTLEASTPYAGQVHMWGGTGNDTFILDMTNFTHHQGHHVYGGVDADKFKFVNIEKNEFYKTGRIDDYDHSQDEIWIEDTKIELEDLPKEIILPSGAAVDVRIINYEQIDILDQGLGPQQVLVIDNKIFYAIEGAREKSNLHEPQPGEERHFFTQADIEKMKDAPSVKFVDPQNFVPHDFYAHRDDLALLDGPRGATIEAPDEAIHFFGGKSRLNDVTGNNWRSAQEIKLSDHNNVVNGNTGNNTIFGGRGDDLIAGGTDNDLIYGTDGNNMIWGGSGDDTLFGGSGDDFLDGGIGDDYLHGGRGNDTLVGGQGNDTLIGSGEDRGDEDANRFHFANGDGNDVIKDFSVFDDILSFQDDVDPKTIKIFEDDEENTVVFYGANNTVTLNGVTLQSFQEAAEDRMFNDDPILIVTPDPELELLRDLQVELGIVVSDDFSSIELDGIEYGAGAFWSDEPGGYTYGRPDAIKESSNEQSEDPDPDISEIVPIKTKVSSDSNQSESEDDDDDEEESQRSDSSCFVATAAYRDPDHPDVVFLRYFRDSWLKDRALGRRFIAFYWKVGPSLAQPVRRSLLLSLVARSLIRSIVWFIRRVWM